MVGITLHHHYLRAVLIIVSGLFLLAPLSQSTALSGSEFQAGRIIDDSVFFTVNNISPADVQTFLNAKVPVCDTNGDKMFNSTQTRKQWAEANGKPLPPYTCLKSYSQDTPSKAAEPGLCNQYNGGSKSAASIIFDVGQACGINPKALIVLLQKEQSLITDDWPWPVQYQKATGYGCPDTAPCDSQYYGFFNQVYSAARQFKNYAKNPGSYNYRSGRDNFIQYHPNSGCGGSTVFIANQATAGLYNYTPYQPNAAALNNLYGTGDSCSAYGNRNFWRLFHDWFGGVNGPPYYWQLASQEAYSDSARTQPYSSTVTATPGAKIYVRVKARNLGYQTWDSLNTYLGTSMPSDRNSGFYDTSWLKSNRAASLTESTVGPSEIGTFEFVLQTPSTPGTYKEYFNIVVEDITWMNDPGMHFVVNVVTTVSAADTSKSLLATNKALLPGEYLLSPDKQSILILQKDGNLVMYENFKPVWNSRTDGNTPGRLAMQGDGNLVLYSNTNQPLWNSATDGSSGAYLTLQTDGNLVVYSPSSVALWNIGNVHNPYHTAYVNTEIKNSKLYPGQQLETPDRRFKLILQDDGNLVLYSPSRATWNSATVGKQIEAAYMQGDGNLVLYDYAGRPVWNSGTAGRGLSSLVIQQDGNLVIYDSISRASWSAGTAGQD